MSKIVVFASFYPKKEKSNEAKEAILAMISPTRSEEGNEIYNFYESKDDDGKMLPLHDQKIKALHEIIDESDGKIIIDDIKDPRISSFVSVLEVRTSKDLNISKIYISVLGDVNIKNKTLKALNSASGYIKNLLLKNLDLKSVPKLSFYLDESIEDKSRILDIIDNLPQASNKNDS